MWWPLNVRKLQGKASKNRCEDLQGGSWPSWTLWLGVQVPLSTRRRVQAPEDTLPPLRAQHSRLGPQGPHPAPATCSPGREARKGPAPHPTPMPLARKAGPMRSPSLPPLSLEGWACGHRRPRDLPAREGHARGSGSHRATGIWVGRQHWGGRWGWAQAGDQKGLEGSGGRSGCPSRGRLAWGNTGLCDPLWLPVCPLLPHVVIWELQCPYHPRELTRAWPRRRQSGWPQPSVCWLRGQLLHVSCSCYLLEGRGTGCPCRGRGSEPQLRALGRQAGLQPTVPEPAAPRKPLHLRPRYEHWHRAPGFRPPSPQDWRPRNVGASLTPAPRAVPGRLSLTLHTQRRTHR